MQRWLTDSGLSIDGALSIAVKTTSVSRCSNVGAGAGLCLSREFCSNRLENDDRPSGFRENRDRVAGFRRLKGSLASSDGRWHGGWKAAAGAKCCPF